MKRILVIDDDEAIRKVFLLALEDSEFQTDTAPGGRAGLNMVAQADYAAVFLDLKMPGMDGIETLKRLRAVNADVPVYIITAFSGEYFDELAHLKTSGFEFELVRKPIGAQQILQITRSILSNTVMAI